MASSGPAPTHPVPGDHCTSLGTWWPQRYPRTPLTPHLFWVLLWDLALRTVSTRINPQARVHPSLGACNRWRRWEHSACETLLRPCLAFNAPGIESSSLEGWRQHNILLALLPASSVLERRRAGKSGRGGSGIGFPPLWLCSVARREQGCQCPRRRASNHPGTYFFVPPPFCCWGCGGKLKLERPVCSVGLVGTGCVVGAFLGLWCQPFPGHKAGTRMGSCWQKIGWIGGKKSSSFPI